MRGRSGRVLLVTSITSCLVIGALVMASIGVASAQSRAANRWNHVAAPAPSTDDEVAASMPARANRVITLHELFGDKSTFIDVGASGDSPGDYGVFKDPIADPRTNEVIGTINVQCIAAYADQCRGSIRLRGRGQITFDGITPLGVDPDRFAVTGGTGEFAAAGGLLVVSFPSDTYALLTLHLT